jgi:hypothetical protein
MTLDRITSHKLERNGMTVAITAVYDLDTDDSHYEVSKKLADKELSLSMFHTLAEAMTSYKALAMEIGATERDVFHSKVK